MFIYTYVFIYTFIFIYTHRFTCDVRQLGVMKDLLQSITVQVDDDDANDDVYLSYKKFITSSIRPT
jgi:hypothetical protein